MKRVLSVLLAACLLLSLPMAASAKGINRYTEVMRKLIAEKTGSCNYGIYYDLNGDDIEELLVIRMRENAEFSSVNDLTASLYTVVDGKAEVLLEDEVLYTDVGGPQGELSVVEMGGKLYACTYGESGATSPPMMRRNGWWKVYEVDAYNHLQTVMDIKYHFLVPDYHTDIDQSQSGATMNGTAVSYAEYEAWEKGLKKKKTLQWGGKGALTFNNLLKKAQADKTGDLGPTPTRPTVGGFKDVYEDDYYASAVTWAVSQGITSGKGDANTFKPGDSCTRAEIVTFLWRAKGQPKVSGETFSDVPAGSYYEDAVKWAVKNEITLGAGGKFNPNDTCTRAQAMTFLWRANGKPSGTGSAFGDVASGSYYADAVKWAVGKGITGGTGSGMFSPDNTCQRGQIVTFLHRDAVN